MRVADLHACGLRTLSMTLRLSAQEFSSNLDASGCAHSEGEALLHRDNHPRMWNFGLHPAPNNWVPADCLSVCPPIGLFRCTVETIDGVQSMPCHLVRESPPVVPFTTDLHACGLRAGRIIDSVGGDEPSLGMCWYLCIRHVSAESPVTHGLP